MIITLLSDFGYRDNFVGIAKALLIQQLPNVQLIDLSHDVMAFHTLECSYYLKTSTLHFPAGTIHLSLFDIMHQNPARLLITEINGQFILGSDNGLIPLSFPKVPKKVFDAGIQVDSYYDWIKKTAIFLKEWKDNDFNTNHLQEVIPVKSISSIEPLILEESLECQVIHVDKYGNVVINITKEEFEEHRKGRDFNIFYSRTSSINKISVDYSNVPEGEKLCRFNSGNFLELAINKGSAAQLFDLSIVRESQLIYKKIIINF